ncbi:MAG: ABC transporter permease [Clostridia bacterium]|nr:ABC transporter permease [Clostridia bacterium]
MAKFCRLIGNEWKKQFSKVATWIMLIFLTAVTLFSSLIGNANQVLESFYTPENYWQDDLQRAKQNYEELKSQYGPDEVWVKTAKVEVDYYSYLIDHAISSDDWRYETRWSSNLPDGERSGNIIHEMIYATVFEEERAAKLSAMVENKDLAAYYAWTFEDVLKDSDPERREIYEWAYRYLIDHSIEPTSSDWRYGTLNEVVGAKFTKLDQERLQKEGLAGYSEVQYNRAKDQITLGVYRLDHNQERNPADSFEPVSSDIPEAFRAIFTLFEGGDGESPFWNSMLYSVTFLEYVAVLCIVIGGSIVSSEFSAGTIKFLLINPARRWKILMSKYATTLLFGVLATTGVFLLSFLMSLAFNGTVDAFRPALSVKGGEVVTTSPYWLLFVRYLSASVKVLVMTTFAFALSALSRSSALSIGISLAISFNASIVVMIMQLAGLDFARYFIFANWDFAAIVNKSTGFVHHSLPLAIVIVALHLVVLIWTAWDAFVRREV